MDCIFCKIATGEIPANVVYENDNVLAFRDLNPQAPHHILIIPRRHIATINELTPDERSVVGDMALAAGKIAKDLAVDENGYRLVLNCNEDGGQTVFHIHMHFLAGRRFQWPPG